MGITLPVNVAPGSPITYEFFQQYIESQAQDAAAEVATTAALEGASYVGPAASGYLGWSVPVWHATSTLSLTTTDIFVVAVYVPAAGTATYCDVNATVAGTTTVNDTALYSLTGTKLAQAATAQLTSNAGVWSTGINTWTYATPAALAAGVYYATLEITGSPTATVTAAPASAVINANLPTNQYNNATYSTGTIPASLTIANLVASVAAQPWVGIR
jgi:hypothetical protein